MSTITNLLTIMKEKNISQTQLCEHIGINTSTMTNWKNRQTDPPAKYIIPICEFLGVTPYMLLVGDEKSSIPSINLNSEEQELLNNFRKLSKESKCRILERAEVLAELEIPEIPKPIITYIDLYDMPVSAGTGVDLSGYYKEELKVKRSSEAEQADFCLRISGDSMEPDYHGGDIILVKGRPTIQIGEIGVFVVNGSGYIKELGKNKLISLNDEYEDIILTENDSVWCMGEVIATLEDDDILG